MLTGIDATICRGYTADDHLIDGYDEAAVLDAVAGIEFRRASDALRAAERAFAEISDWRVVTARIRVRLRTARGDEVTVG